MPGQFLDVEQTGLDRVVEPWADEAQATSSWSVFGSPPLGRLSGHSPGRGSLPLQSVRLGSSAAEALLADTLATST